MSEFAAPSVATYGSTDPSAPLVVLLHGRGSHEREIIALAEHLPVGPAYAAVRAPIAEGGGFAWFANRGIGRPVAESLASTMNWFGDWLDEVAPVGRPVVLVGFSGGAAFVRLKLPRPYGTTRIRLVGAVGAVDVSVPVASAVQVRLGGGAGTVRAPWPVRAPFRPGAVLTAPAWHTTADRYVIDSRSGLGALTVSGR